MFFRKALSAFLIAGLLAQAGQGAFQPSTFLERAPDACTTQSRFDRQALTLPVLFVQFCLSPLVKARENRAAMAQEISALNGSSGLSEVQVEGWRWVSRDYLDALYQLLNVIKDDVHYDFSQVKRIRFVPWYAGFGRMESDGASPWASASKEEILLVAHWHPRVFLRELSYKVTQAARRMDDAEDILGQSWTSTAEKPALAGRLYKRLIGMTFLATAVAWMAAPLAWPNGNWAARVLVTAVALGLQGYVSYSKGGLVAQAIAHARGKPALLLDPAKPMPLLPPSSLENSKNYWIDQAAGQLPRIAVVRTITRPAALLISMVLHAALLIWIVPSGPAWVALAVVTMVLAWSLLMTLLRLMLLPSDAPHLHGPAKAPGRSALLSFSREASRLAQASRLNLKWGVPLLLLIAFINPVTRTGIIDDLMQVKQDLDELVEVYLPPEYKPLPLYDPYLPENTHRGQEGTAKTPGQRKAKPSLFPPAPRPANALPQDLPTPPILPTPPSATPTQENAPAQEGIGGRKVFVWEQAYLYHYPNYSPPSDPVANPFQLTRAEASRYGGFSSSLEKSVDGNIIGIRLNIRQSDPGKLVVGVDYWAVDARWLVKYYPIDLPAHAKEEPPLPIDILFADKDFELKHDPTPSPPQLSVSIRSAEVDPTMRADIQNVTVLTGPDLPGRRYHSGPAPVTIVPDDDLGSPVYFGGLRDVMEGKARALAARINRNRRYLQTVPENAQIPILLYIDSATDLPTTKIVTKRELIQMVNGGEVDYSIPTHQWIWNIHRDLGSLQDPSGRRPILAQLHPAKNSGLLWIAHWLEELPARWFAPSPPHSTHLADFKPFLHAA